LKDIPTETLPADFNKANLDVAAASPATRYYIFVIP